MKSIRNVLTSLFVLGGFVASFGLVHAQDTTSPDSIVRATADAAGLTPVSATDLPETGTFWLVSSNGILSPNPCPPPNAADLPIYGLTDSGQFLVDATGGLVTTNEQPSVADALAALAGVVEDLINQVQGAQVASGLRAMSLASPDDPGDGSGDGSFLPSFSIPTNGLWLQITNVADGLASVNLMNATDSVYEIWSKTDLSLTNWTIEAEVWPTDTNCMPFTVPTLDRTNLFVWARDWTGIDENSNGLPDWWEWKYFGDFNQATNGDYDNDGVSIGYEYAHSIDPNKIQFFILAANDHVNSSFVPVQLDINGGVASYLAMADTTNFDGEGTWNTYTSSNIVAYLDPVEGMHQVWIGLRGRPADAHQTWQEMTFILDTTPPVIMVTNPVAGTVSQPFIQVQGLANEELSSLTFDVSNAAGMFTNQPGFVTGEFYDTNLLAFTTNYFQCYDVALTNGLNLITLHTADLAGNATTTNFNVTLDYAGDTTPPVVQLVWPNDGTVISGDDFILQARLDDTTAQVTAMVVDSSGDTNMVQGSVQGDGTVWAKTLPLSNGTNAVTVTATDAAGNASVTNFNVVRSAVTVTIDPLAADQLNQSSVNVSGTVSNPSEVVVVNGVTAAVDTNGVWNVEDVTVSADGVADIDVEAYPGESDLSSTPPDGGQHADEVQPPAIKIYAYDLGWDYWENTHLTSFYYCSDGVNPCGPAERTNLYFQDCRQVTKNSGQTHWVAGQGGFDRTASDEPTGLCVDAPVHSSSWDPVATNAYAGETWGEFDDYQESDIYDNGDPYTDAYWIREKWGMKIGAGKPGTTRLYLVSALMQDGHGLLPYDWFKIRGQTPTAWDETDPNPKAWGQTIITVPASVTNLDVTPTGGAALKDFQLVEEDGFQEVYYQFQMDVQEVGVTTLESRDRLVHGVIEGVGNDVVNVTIKNESKNLEGVPQTQDLGTYYDVLGNGAPGTAQHQTYDNDDDILSDAEVTAIENGTYNFGDQKVIFVRDPSDPLRVHFYTLADNYGRLTVTLNAASAQLQYAATNSTQLTQESFGDTINYLDTRIDSSELVSVPLVPFGGAPPPIQQRSLLVKTLLGIVKGGVNPPLALVRGSVEGFMGGAHSDYDGILGVWTLITSSAQRAAAFKALTTWNTYAQIPNAIETGAANFMTTAEVNGVTFQFGQADFTDDVSVRSYVGGYAAGFTTEQICVAAVGAGIAAKAGTAAKLVIATTSVGQKVLDGVAASSIAVQRFKTLSVDFAINSAQKAARTTGLPQAAEAMADAVSKLPYDSTRTIGQVINQYVDRLDIIQQELAAIGQPLNDFGVKAQAQLAKLLDRDLGSYPGENALRGDIRLYQKLVVGSGDRYDNLIQLFKKADGTVDTDSLESSLEAFKDATDATTTQPKFYLKNPDVAHPMGYRYMDDISIITGNDYKLPVSSANGWYSTFDQFSQSSDAVSKLQLPTGSTAKYRVEFATESVKDNIRVPYGHQEQYDWFEPLAADYPEYGTGGGTQILISDTEIPITAIWDISGPTPVRIY